MIIGGLHVDLPGRWSKHRIFVLNTLDWMMTISEQALFKELGLQPYALHTTFQFAGTEGKRHRLREAKLFYDPPDYYDVPG